MPASLLQLAADHFGGLPVSSLTCDIIQKGASGRGIFRLSAAGHGSVIGIDNDGQREENADFVKIAKWLGEQGLPVPAILAEQGTLCLTEDFGTLDLLEVVTHEPWEKAKLAYQSALDGLLKLQALPPQPPFELKRCFDLETYLWEQDYFFEHLWSTHLKRSELPDRAPFSAIARELSSSRPTLVHRDFQSQNLMVTRSFTGFIDFQGMRPGHGEYDLASLLFDPYARLTEAQRNELLSYWGRIGGSLDSDRFLKCAMQRLMQALGAFANISHNLGNSWYLQHIDPACRDLELVLKKLKLASLGI